MRCSKLLRGMMLVPPGYALLLSLKWNVLNK